MSQYDSLFATDEAERAKTEGQPFALPDLWRSSTFSADPSLGSTLFDVKFSQPPTSLPFPKNNETGNTLFHIPQELKLPSLPGLQTNIWPPVDEEPRSDPTTATTDESENLFSSILDDEDQDDDGDIWMDPETVVPLKDPRFFTWDSFLVEGANEPLNGYITEAGPAVLDAALEEGGDRGVIVRADVFCTCLLHLGLGRSSVLFLWDQKKESFKLAREGLRISGCTAGTIENIIKTFAECGTNIKKLERFANSVYKDPRVSSPALVALAQCTTTITESIQKRLSTSNHSIRSILHLHSLIRDPALIVDSFVQLTSATNGTQDDCQLLSRLFDVIQQQQHRSGWLKPLLVETLARVSRPWLEFVEQWIGLDEGPGGLGITELVRKGGFVAIEESSELDETGKERVVKNFVFEKSQVPSFISAESAETLFETGRSLRFLEMFHPRHPLSVAVAARSATAPKLHWKFSWQDLEDLQTQAKTYEQNLRAAIHKYTMHQSESPSPDDAPGDQMDVEYPFETFGKSKEELSDTFLESLEVMNRSLPSLETTSEQDPLATMVLHLTRFSTDSDSSQLTTFAPPFSITPLHSFSHILSAQSRLINNACLRMFFKEHNIRDHLLLLRRFQLFGDGVFSSRLAHALFDADLDDTERKEGVVRSGGTMGLKLGSRDTWPPASSELRLALMDVLTECFAQKTGIHVAGKAGELPGGLSFAVREMSDEELEACMDPNSISALDFLKLEYRPPSPLQAIITPTAMYRYDRIFRLLLRVLRMVFVVNTLWRDANRRQKQVDPVTRRFGIEARHFVTTLANYMMESGIGTTWSRFERKLEEIEKGLDDNQGGGEESLDRLRAYHESILDRIMFATLSRKRQQPVMKIVDEIFALVLKFASRKDAGIEEVETLYRSFRRRVGIFIGVCRGLSEKRGYGDGRSDLQGQRGAAEGVFGTGYKEEANLLGMLLLGLEMSGYYSKAVGKRR
ncbi:hypothetical protein K440DRAFT_607795 [Wilcoxina mikolae CBS 423.85]|nr:hypothetical protein K440DRAFT_607795 [Wilcoxina mikolae CBS 423.85]